MVSEGRLTLNNTTEDCTESCGQEKKNRSKSHSKKWHLPTKEDAIFLLIFYLASVAKFPIEMESRFQLLI
ncbi:hypothetical protein J2Y02_002477 [Neobacillus drentensis]|nr:hypothetical protein [Neobacillus drentensis]